jgi:hypothetical protein
MGKFPQCISATARTLSYSDSTSEGRCPSKSLMDLEVRRQKSGDRMAKLPQCISTTAREHSDFFLLPPVFVLVSE